MKSSNTFYFFAQINNTMTLHGFQKSHDKIIYDFEKKDNILSKAIIISFFLLAFLLKEYFYYDQRESIRYLHLEIQSQQSL